MSAWVAPDAVRRWERINAQRSKFAACQVIHPPEDYVRPCGAMRSGPGGCKIQCYARLCSTNPMPARTGVSRKQATDGLEPRNSVRYPITWYYASGPDQQTKGRHQPTGEPTLSQSPQSDTNLYGFAQSMARVI